MLTLQSQYQSRQENFLVLNNNLQCSHSKERIFQMKNENLWHSVYQPNDTNKVSHFGTSGNPQRRCTPPPRTTSIRMLNVPLARNIPWNLESEHLGIKCYKMSLMMEFWNVMNIERDKKCFLFHFSPDCRSQLAARIASVIAHVSILNPKMRPFMQNTVPYPIQTNDHVPWKILVVSMDPFYRLFGYILFRKPLV